MSPTYRDILVSQGVTHHWPLDETVGTTAVALSGGTNLTINSAGVTLGARAAVGAGMTFAGGAVGQYLYSPTTSDASFDVTRGFSISWMMYVTSNTINHGIISKRIGSTDTTHFAVFFLQNQAGTLHVDLGGNQSRWITGWTPALNTWYHCVFTYSPGPSTRRLYINGEQFASTTTYVPLASSGNAPIYIATLAGSTGSGFAGTLDEMALFIGKTLSAEEVLLQYNTVFPVHWVYDGTKWVSGNKRTRL